MNLLHTILDALGRLGLLPGSARRIAAIALALLIPPITSLLVAIALCGVGIVLFFGVLLRLPTFHAEPIWIVSGLCLGTAASLHVMWYRLVGADLT